MGSNKKGRPAKPGERYPSGKLKPIAEPMSGALWQRLKQNAKKLSLDPRLTTELGRLNWFGELTSAQTAAGHRIAGIYGRFERAKGKRRSAASPSYMIGGGDDGIAEELLGEDALEQLETRIRGASAAFQMLCGSARRGSDPGTEGLIPRRLMSQIEALCVEDRSISPVWYPEIRLLLQRLAVHWKITGGAKPAPNDQRGKLGAHTPLHFNKHEGEPEAKPAAAAKKPNIDRIFFIQVCRKLRPDLSEDQLGHAWDVQQTLKQREIFNRSKEGQRDNVVPLRTEFRKYEGDRPVLKLRGDIDPENPQSE